MNNIFESVGSRGSEEVIAHFGQGRLVRVSRLLLEMRGGSREDEIEAGSWVAMFLPEMVLSPRKPALHQFTR